MSASAATTSPTTLFDKVWNSRIVLGEEGGPQLLYVHRHILHEGSTPLAFEAMRAKGRPLHHVEAMLGVIDHSIPTSPRVPMVAGPEAVEMMAAFHKNAAEFGVTIYGEHDPRQGVSHVVSPEQGFTLPGIVMVCGDSHTSTHGAFGAYAFGIGTTEVEHVLPPVRCGARSPPTCWCGSMAHWLPPLQPRTLRWP